MRFDLRQFVRYLTACLLVTVFAVPPSLLAQASTHLVNPSELQKAAVNATQTRQANLGAVREFLSSERATDVMKSAHMDPTQVKNAVSSLSDAELARLASRAQLSQADFAAGRLGDRDLLIIILAIAALVLIIVAVR
jgi:hypothetical protein